MTLRVNPPPLQPPADFLLDKPKAAFFGALINTIYQLWTAVYGLQTSATVRTTDSTVTALIRTEIPEGKTVMLECMVVARRTGGSAGSVGDSAFYRLTGAYKNISGVLTGIGSPNLIGGEDQAAWDLGFSTSGTYAVVAVTGANNNNITWEGTLSIYVVGA